MSTQVRKAVRATLILFPLLGITNLLFFINPKSLQRREHEYIYMLVNSVLKSSQVKPRYIQTYKNLTMDGFREYFFLFFTAFSILKSKTL